jgi:hypothetical protein
VKSTFRISRVYDDGSEADTLIVPVTALPAGIRMDRRVFFRAGVTLSGVAVVLTGCGSPDKPAAAATTPGTAASPSALSSSPHDSLATKSPQAHVAKKAPPVRRPRPKPIEEPEPYPYRASPPTQPYGGYIGGRTTLGETITRPCTPEPVPPGYVCTCNCVAR